MYMDTCCKLTFENEIYFSMDNYIFIYFMRIYVNNKVSINLRSINVDSNLYKYSSRSLID